MPAAAQAQSSASSEPSREAGAAREGRIEVARLTYRTGDADRAAPVCLSDDFLTTLARETDLPVKRELGTVALSSDRLFDYPFVIFTGGWSFSLSEAQQANLKRYLDRGGFVLASASCSNARWAESFERLIGELYPGKRFKSIDAGHALRHTLYDIERIDTRRPSRLPAIRGLSVGGRLAVVYSPVGLNDTASAGGGCCCCGGNEVTSARIVNANILAYALTH